MNKYYFQRQIKTQVTLKNVQLKLTFFYLPYDNPSNL